MSGEFRCRVCSRPVELRLDDTVKTHKYRGSRCDGSLQALAGEPPCALHCGREVGRVSWPADLDPAHQGAMASTYVCERPSHQREAAAWVREKTGHDGVFTEFKAAARV